MIWIDTNNCLNWSINICKVHINESNPFFLTFLFKISRKSISEHEFGDFLKRNLRFRSTYDDMFVCENVCISIANDDFDPQSNIFFFIYNLFACDLIYIHLLSILLPFSLIDSLFRKNDEKLSVYKNNSLAHNYHLHALHTVATYFNRKR